MRCCPMLGFPSHRSPLLQLSACFFVLSGASWKVLAGILDAGLGSGSRRSPWALGTFTWVICGGKSVQMQQPRGPRERLQCLRR